MQLYTTQKIDGVEIESYLGLVIATQVSGTGFLSDLTASISDIFGGHSGTYRNAMNDLCEDVLKQLKEKAELKGANAIIGVHIDFDNISAKGMSMFMVSAQGTAVKLSDNSKNYSRYNMYRLLHEIKSFLDEGIISQDDYEIEAKRIRSDFEKKVNIDKADFVNELKKKEEFEQEHELELRIIRNNERKEELITRGIEILKSLNLSSGSADNIQQINSLSGTEITDSSYDDIDLNGSNMYEDIKKLTEMGRYAEACKVYIDYTGLEADDAKEYVVSVYSQCKFVNNSAYNQLSSKLVTAMLEDKKDAAIKTFVDSTKMAESVAKNILDRIME